tara:strand:+ start:282 stop:671 length:390 start_codon:yes stop_codon:yes gene_type:complete
MEKFNFKVGDKICIEGSSELWVEVLNIDGRSLNSFICNDKDRFIGLSSDSMLSPTYVKNPSSGSWKLYEEPKEKTKIQKFYCYDVDSKGVEEGGVTVRYSESSESMTDSWDYALTEEEFNKQFEIVTIK